jgi:hypothetical protein
LGGLLQIWRKQMEVRLGGRASRNFRLKAWKFIIMSSNLPYSKLSGEMRERIEYWDKDAKNLPRNEANYPAAPENGQNYPSNSNELKTE